MGALAPERASRLLLFAQRRILRDVERKFSSVQVDIRGDAEKMILEYGKSIPEDQLYYGEGGEGHETNVHVTIKYGLHEESVEPVKELLNEVGPIELFLGRTAMFESENYDVLYVQIESEDLRRLNAYIADSMEVTDTHPSYTPHCTIAYLKKGCAVHYLGDDRFDGIPLSLDTITFGSVNGSNTTFRVASAEPSPLWQDAEDGIARTFTFDDRRKLASFVSSVFKHANSVNHHPDVRTNGDSARISYCTHSQNDEVTNLDLESAVVVDMLAKTYGVKETSTRFARGENQLHTAADKRLGPMRDAVLKAFKQGAGKINKNKLRAALMTKNRKTASQAVEGVQTAVQNSLWRSLPGILSETLQEGGKAGVRMLKQRLGIRAAARSDDEFIDWEFDDTNENAVQWVEEHGAELAKGLSQTTQDEINDALKDAFEGGDLNEAIDLIVNAVGDADRADLIARTELMRASNEGQRQAWSQAVDEGVLTGDERKTWIATEVGACDECDALDGEIVDLDGEYPNDGGDGPPLHPRCRCTEGIVYSEPKALRAAGDVPGHPFHGNQWTNESRETRIKEIDRQIHQISISGGGNTAKAIKERMRSVTPLTSEQEIHRNYLDPTRPEAVLTSSKLVKRNDGGFDVHHDSKKIGSLEPITYTGFKTVNSAQQMASRTGFKATYEGNVVSSQGTKKEGHEAIAHAHSTRLRSKTLGGKGSGNFGHSGRPGEQGGSGGNSATLGEKSSKLLKSPSLFVTDHFNSAKFVLRDGTMLGHREDTHLTAAKAAGVDLYEVLGEGTIRLTGGSALEVGGPITSKQAKTVVTGLSWMQNDNDPLYGMFNKLHVDVFNGKKRDAVVLSGREVNAEKLRNWVNSHYSPRAAGGKGSGNFGHEGRPGEKGGSSSSTTSISSILSGEKVGEALGSNPGGVYKTKSGEKWYIKEYKTKEQAYGEHLSNALYHEVGVGAPQSIVEEHDGKTVYASKWLPNSEGILQDVGLNKKNADAVLDGFAADAFLANWDAVGTGLDNIMVHHGGQVSRVDSGGSLLHRAQGALKPESVLDTVGEWKSLSDPAKAPYYSKVFKKAGVENADALGSRAVKQIDDILRVGEKTGEWKGFVETHIPKAPREYKDKVASVLEARTGSLRDIRARVSKLRSAGGAGSGNFGHQGRPGEVGGSVEGGGAGAPGESTTATPPKGKHDYAKVQLALKMKADGATLAQIKKETGLHPSTTNYYMSKMKAKEAALKGEFIAKPKPSTPSSYYWKKNSETGKYEKTLTGYGKQKEKELQEAGAASAKQYAESKGDPYGIGKQFAEKDKLESEKLAEKLLKEEGKFSEPSSGATLQTANSLSEVATKYGYEWQKKTTGPQAGKYAWFQNGVQVSVSHAESDKDIAAASMHFNTGPKTPQVESHATEWPIGSDVARSLGKNYPKEIDAKYAPWVASLTDKQRQAIESYTGTSYGDINAQLRAGKSFDDMSTYMKPKAKNLQEAIDKAPNPPPPELVWRGLGSLGANSFISKLGVGDEIELKGFQSTSINPLTAKSWHHTDIPFLEIQPKKGAYVQSISEHKAEREYILPHGAKYKVKGLASIPIYELGGVMKRKVLQLEML